MVPPQPDSGSSGCPPATTIVSFGLLLAWASGRARPSIPRSGTAAPVTLMEFLSHLRRESVLMLLSPLRVEARLDHGCSISSTKWRVTAPAMSGPAELTSPYQRSGRFLSHGGWSSHSAFGMM